MQRHVPAAIPTTRQPLWLVILSAGTIVGLAMGLRQVFGLYLMPVTGDLGIGREPFSTAMAVDERWGIWSIRGRLLWYLEAVIEMTDAASLLPGTNLVWGVIGRDTSGAPAGRKSDSPIDTI